MSDLLARLKDFALCDDGCAPYNANGPLVDEAVVEIERLTAALQQIVDMDDGPNELRPAKDIARQALARGA